MATEAELYEGADRLMSVSVEIKASDPLAPAAARTLERCARRAEYHGHLDRSVRYKAAALALRVRTAAATR